MENKTIEKQKMVEDAKRGVLSKFPLLGSVVTGVEFMDVGNAMSTAATDGKKILYNGDFLASLSYNERVGVFAHEIMHIAFNHIMRSKDKDSRLWNIATDSVINQMLRDEGIELPDETIDMPEAKNKSAEDMYDKILEEIKNRQQQENANDKQGGLGENSQGTQSGEMNAQNGASQGGNSQGQNGASQGGRSRGDSQSASSHGSKGSAQGQNNDNNFDLDKVLGGKSFDSHDIWKDAVEKAENREQPEIDKQADSKKDVLDKDEQVKGGDEQAQQNENSTQDFEREFVEQNRKEKEQIARKIIDDLKQQRTDEYGAGSQDYSLGAVGKAKAVVSWKKILKKELIKNDDRWCYRRACEDNDYQARIGDIQVEDKPKTEVILDVSGSIDEDLLRSFLRQLKTLVDDNELKVGIFSDDFWGWKVIKTKKEIDKIKLAIGGGTNYDSASRAFSKGRDTNRIVFTDGGWGEEIVDKRNDIIWISFENSKFKPDYGKVIYVSPKEIQNAERDRDREL